MIARLKGILAETAADHAVLDVQGVGYLAWCSGRTLGAIGEVGGDVLLFTEMQVREDAITLFGFGSAGERDAFRLLTSVQGVGGRVALAILSVLDVGTSKVVCVVAELKPADEVESLRSRTHVAR